MFGGKYGILNIFDDLTAGWFRKTLGEPTKVQNEAWPAIAEGCDVLVSAPTGTGKTLSAFLVFIDRLKNSARKGTLKNELHLIYISPLKSLAGDIRENLRRPLDGIFTEERLNGTTDRNSLFDINISVRTGDTSASERRSMVKKPPHILITTPESLYLLLTSVSGRNMLKTARAVVIDELHALIGSKRGSHLMLSLARLDGLCDKPLQRIGLSATINPLEEAARYLSPEDVFIAAPKMDKLVDIKVVSPLADSGLLPPGTIWHDIARCVYESCQNARSVIAFVEGRLFAEKLAHYVNQIAGDGFARTHHGSISKERRLHVEQSLRGGSLKLLCATSSMELGIDVGDIDLVLQIGCPRSISSTLQRLGRAGHNPGRVSQMLIFPRMDSETLFCGLSAKVASSGNIEKTAPPRLCLDILAQHIVSMAAGDPFSISDLMEILKRAYPFKDVSEKQVKDICVMLAGDYEHGRDIPVRPRILYDRINERIEGDNYSRFLAVSAGGTIPDRGLFPVKGEGGVKLGELDEEFVFEARVGDKFLLGSFAWKITAIRKDEVIVSQSNPSGARPPFFKADWTGRGFETGLAFGALLRELSGETETDRIILKLEQFGMDRTSAETASNLLTRQLNSTGAFPDDRTIILEHFKDDAGEKQLMVHSIFGRRINAPLGLLMQEAAKRVLGSDVGCFDDNDGFLLFPYGTRDIPPGLLHAIDPENAYSVLNALLPSTPLFNMAFRYNAARALLFGIRKAGRQPLWVQRLRGAELLDSVINFEDHPVIVETKRECLEDYWDLGGVMHILRGVQSGAIEVREVFNDSPSPLSLPLRRQAESVLLYEYAPTTSKIQRSATDALDTLNSLTPDSEDLEKASQRSNLPENEKQLHSLLMIEGDLIAGELELPSDWFESLLNAGRVKYIEPGLWIASEHEEKYNDALNALNPDALLHVIRRTLRYRGAQNAQSISERYFIPVQTASVALNSLAEQKSAVLSGSLYYHEAVFGQAVRETVKSRRFAVTTQPAERYAALIAGKLRINAPPAEQLEAALRSQLGIPHPLSVWENVILPARVKAYRPEMLDTFLTSGVFYWRTDKSKNISFHLSSDVDWDCDMQVNSEALSESERIIYEAILKRGALSPSAMPSLLGGEFPYEVLASLTEKGLIHADNLSAFRHWNKTGFKTHNSNVKQRISSRVLSMSAGRFEVTRPEAEKDFESELERAFDCALILCRETIKPLNLSWAAALELLRTWEFTGRVRRGYFIEGLSGAQFIRSKDFKHITAALERPITDTVWLSASDPAQVWGKTLPHMQGRSFLNVPGTAVALVSGIPAVVFERQGQVLRVFEPSGLKSNLNLFARCFDEKRVFAGIKRINVKQFPPSAGTALSESGFIREMDDFALYLSYK